MITAQLLGGASLRAGDRPLGGPPAQRHRLALLTLVVAAWPQPVSRDRAMALPASRSDSDVSTQPVASNPVDRR